MSVPLHAGPSAVAEAVLVVLLPLAGLGQGLVAGLVTLPLAWRLRGWLLQRRGDPPGTPVASHLAVAATLGGVEAILAFLVVLVVPDDLLTALALVRPSVPWALAFGAGALLLWVGVGLADRPATADGASPLSPPARRLVGTYLLAVVAAGVLGVEMLFVW